MVNEVQMFFQVEPGLKTEFYDAVSLEDRPAAQVLGDLMRAYVEQSRERNSHSGNLPFSPTFQDTAESRRREAAVAFARSSVGLEGFTPSAQAETRASQFIKGEIGLGDFVQVNPGVDKATDR